MQFRELPSVDSVMSTDAVAGVVKNFSREWLLNLVRQELDQARKLVGQGATAPSAPELAASRWTNCTGPWKLTFPL